MSDGQSTGTQNQEGTQPEVTSSKAGERTFTQSELNERVQKIKADTERSYKRKEEDLARSAVQRYLQDLGFESDDLDEVKGKLSQALGKESEAQSLERKLKLVEGRAVKAEQRLAEIEAKRRESELRARVVEIAQADCNDVELLYDHLRSRGRIGFDKDGEQVVFDERGDVAIGITLEQIIKDTLASKPHLLRAAPTFGGGSRPPVIGQQGQSPKPSSIEAIRQGLHKLYGG